MEQKKFNVGIEIPQGMQEALLGGQGIEGISVTISLAASANLSSNKDKDSDADTTTTTTTQPSVEKEVRP